MRPFPFIRRASAEEIFDLRHAVLRHGLPRETAIFPGDDATTARHYAAIAGDRIIGCATLHLNQWNGRPAWQLRGMATDPDFRGVGTGSALIDFFEAEILSDPTAPRQLWCNARVPAAGFYQKLGWQIESEVFDIPTAGPHVKMSKLLKSA
jgi:GNAT superfamily N-acetyltransferase